MATRDCEDLVFTGHAIHQMFARQLATDAIKSVIAQGETIAAYPDERPYPSELLLGFVEGEPIHVVFAYDSQQRTGYVVTAYRPAPDLWDPTFRERK